MPGFRDLVTMIRYIILSKQFFKVINLAYCNMLPPSSLFSRSDLSLISQYYNFTSQDLKKGPDVLKTNIINGNNSDKCQPCIIHKCFMH